MIDFHDNEGGTPAPMSFFCAVICICRREADDHRDLGRGGWMIEIDAIESCVQYSTKRRKGCVTVHIGLPPCMIATEFKSTRHVCLALLGFALLCFPDLTSSSGSKRNERKECAELNNLKKNYKKRVMASTNGGRFHPSDERNDSDLIITHFGLSVPP